VTRPSAGIRSGFFHLAPMSLLKRTSLVYPSEHGECGNSSNARAFADGDGLAL
jgi:hypothetical protein